MRNNFEKYFDTYKNLIINYHSKNPQDPSHNKAMIAMSKTLKRSINARPLTLQNQMHNFGKGTVASNRTKHGGVINVQPPAVVRRTFKVPGRGPAPLSRPMQNNQSKVQMVVTEEDDFMARSDKKFQANQYKIHQLSKNVDNNETAPKRHTKQ